MYCKVCDYKLEKRDGYCDKCYYILFKWSKNFIFHNSLKDTTHIIHIDYD